MRCWCGIPANCTGYRHTHTHTQHGFSSHICTYQYPTLLTVSGSRKVSARPSQFPPCSSTGELQRRCWVTSGCHAVHTVVGDHKVAACRTRGNRDCRDGARTLCKTTPPKQHNRHNNTMFCGVQEEPRAAVRAAHRGITRPLHRTYLPYRQSGLCSRPPTVPPLFAHLHPVQLALSTRPFVRSAQPRP